MAKQNQKLSRRPGNSSPHHRVSYPAVSVIIPVYNAEKYIGEALDSLLAQTFKDFEVIVVDDCSTDNSFAVVESYIPKFNGQLKLAKLKKNSGGAPAPRNRGLKISSGEYVFFMDADDALVPTALDELYSVAKEFVADVVHCNKYYSSPGESANTDKSVLTVKTAVTSSPINVPALDTKSLKDRVQNFVQYKFWWTPWSHLIRREVLIENDIEFPKINIADDQIFTIYVYFSAEKVVETPNAVYVWRTLQGSNSREDWTNTQIEKVIHRRVNDTFLGIRLLNKFAEGFDLFQKEPQYKYALIDFYVNTQIWNLRMLYHKFPAITFDNLIQKEFTAIGNDPVVAAFLFDKMMTLYVTSMLNQNELISKFNQFAAQAQNRIAELESEIKRLKTKE